MRWKVPSAAFAFLFEFFFTAQWHERDAFHTSVVQMSFIIHIGASTLKSEKQDQKCQWTSWREKAPRGIDSWVPCVRFVVVPVTVSVSDSLA